MIWRSLRTAAWLGWQIESNWTDPFLFAIYSIIKPLTSAGILVVMYAMVTKSNFASTAFSYMYLGNAFYIYVGAVMTGMTYAVVEDRERGEKQHPPHFKKMHADMQEQHAEEHRDQHR